MGSGKKSFERDRTSKKCMGMGDQARIFLVPMAVAPALELPASFAENCEAGLSDPPSTDVAGTSLDHLPAYDHSGNLPADL